MGAKLYKVELTHIYRTNIFWEKYINIYSTMYSFL
jgi:hypothetical protein